MLQPFYDYIFRTEAPPQYRNEAKLRVRPLREFQSGEVHTASWALLAAVLLMLLIACANVANLFDKRHITSCFFNNGCYYGASRTFVGSLRYSW